MEKRNIPMIQHLAMPMSSRQLFCDSQSLFSIHVPDGWLVDQSGTQGTRLALFAPQREMGFQANVNIQVQNLHGCSRDDYLAATRLQLQQLTGREQPKRDEPTDCPLGGHLLEWSAPIGTLALHFSQLIVVESDQAYVLTGTAPVLHLPTYRPVFQAVFESFALMPRVSL